ncbi:MAG TPA: hypothetical protein VJL28_08175 [Gemmatimonadaceae bacterium]|nr:hypothetical protein [Gemmatimonadaceae bacterium]
MREGRSILLLVFAPLLWCVEAQRPQFAPTLTWDSGLINTPAAWVPPLGGDIALNFARVAFDSARMPPALAQRGGSAFSVSASAFGRVELGVSVFSGDLRSGLFGKVLVWDQTDGIWRTGAVHWLPSFAVGVRNLGTENTLSRLSRTGLTQLNTSPTLYAVATRTLVLAQPVEGTRPRAQLALSAGAGNGLFSDDGGLEKAYAASASGGVFGGAQLQFATGRFSTVSVLVEHDAWDVNAGAQLEVRGLRVSLSVMELGAESGQTGTLAYRKVAFSLGWQTNLSALVRGNRMAQRTEQYAEQAAELRKQIQAGESRVTSLETQLQTLQRATGAEVQAQIEELRRRLREEQEAVKRLQELLRQREAAKKP